MRSGMGGKYTASSVRNGGGMEERPDVVDLVAVPRPPLGPLIPVDDVPRSIDDEGCRRHLGAQGFGLRLRPAVHRNGEPRLADEPTQWSLLLEGDQQEDDSLGRERVLKRLDRRK